MGAAKSGRVHLSEQKNQTAWEEKQSGVEACPWTARQSQRPVGEKESDSIPELPCKRGAKTQGKPKTPGCVRLARGRWKEKGQRGDWGNRADLLRTRMFLEKKKIRGAEDPWSSNVKSELESRVEKAK